MASAETGNARAKTAVVVEDGGVKTSTWLRMKSVAALAGVVGTTAIQVAFPERASALSIRDPVFGDIEVWQFLVLTAGYFIGIEFYLDNKYDETKQPIMPSVQKKKEETEEEKAE